jgi:pimeloyl-ACP methyl ester carboxylesterase
MGDDIAALIRHLDLGQADLMGYSAGAGTALRTAIQHPGLVRRLVVVSTPCRRDGWHAESLAGFDHLGRQLAGMLTRPAHIAEFYAAVGGGLRDANWDGSARPVARLAVLPSHTHYDLGYSPDLAAVVIPFLDASSLEPPAPRG